MLNKVRSLVQNKKLISERRDKIIDASLELFLTKGYSNTGMRDIAKACEMQLGSIYNYIGKKSDILHLICLREKGSIKILIGKIKNLGDIDTYQKLRLVIKTYAEDTINLGNLILFFNLEIKNFSKRDRTILLQSQLDHFDFFTNLINEGVAEGVFKKNNSRFVAHSILLIPHDWLLRRWALKKYLTVDDYIAEYIKMIMKSIEV